VEAKATHAVGVHALLRHLVRNVGNPGIGGHVTRDDPSPRPRELVTHGDALGGRPNARARPALRRLEIIVGIVSQEQHGAIEIERLDDAAQRIRDRSVESVVREIDECGRDLGDDGLERHPLFEASHRSRLGDPLGRDVDHRREDERPRFDANRRQPDFNGKLGSVQTPAREGTAGAHLARFGMPEVGLPMEGMITAQGSRDQDIDRMAGKLLGPVSEIELYPAVGEQDDAMIIHDHHAHG
jgi:hypothetical protein